MYINCARNAAKKSASTASKKKSRGLSFIELLPALTITAIVTSLAALSYQDAVLKQEVINGANHVSRFIQSVQSQSATRNRRAIISYKVIEDSKWCLGATLDREPCDCNETDFTAPKFCSLDAEPWVFRGGELLGKDLIHSAAGEGHFAFDPVRRLFAGPFESVALGLQSGNQKFQLELSLIATGDTSLCLPQGAEDIRQYESCSQ